MKWDCKLRQSLGINQSEITGLEVRPCIVLTEDGQEDTTYSKNHPNGLTILDDEAHFWGIYSTNPHGEQEWVFDVDTKAQAESLAAGIKFIAQAMIRAAVMNNEEVPKGERFSCVAFKDFLLANPGEYEYAIEKAPNGDGWGITLCQADNLIESFPYYNTREDAETDIASANDYIPIITLTEM